MNRLPAKKVRIDEIVSGKFFPGSKDQMKPSYTVTPLGDSISRVSIVATVVDKFLNEGNSYANFTINDESGLIRAKSFGDIDAVKNIELGDTVLVVGKLKEYQGEVYVNLEILRKVDPNYEIKHKLEVLKRLMAQKSIAVELKRLADSVSEEELREYAQSRNIDDQVLGVILESSRKDVDYNAKVMEIIESLDTGEGVEVRKIFESVSLPENLVEKAIDELLNQGYIYEPRPAVFKKI